MGMLTDAKKKKPEHKKHKHPASMEAEAPADDQPEAPQPEAPQPEAADQPAPDADADDAQGGDDADSGGAAQSPQAPQPDQGDQGGDQGESEDATQDAGSQAPDQQGGDDQQQDGSQGAPPQGGDEDDAPAGAAGQGPQGAQGAAGGPQGNAVDLSQIPISPALKEEYIRCNGALYTALYKNDKVAQAVIKGIVPQGPHKIESVARMSLLLFTQINKQLHFVKDTPQVVLPFARDITEHVLDLATTVAKIQFSDQEAQAAIGAMLELVQRVVGVTKGNIAALRHVIPRSQLQDAHSKYQQHLQYIKGARDASPGPGAPQSTANPGGQTPQGQPDQSQGQPDPSQGQPQAGAPDTAAPGPGQSAPPGGMLSQAAAQPPQGG